jgi:predicted glycoside hydrolase/deacetylase ChbG (UPF0249 family)
MKIRINADDFGISRGVNFAIEKMFQQKKLHSASLIFGCGFFEEAIEIAKRNNNLSIGLHFNLTSGFSASNHKLPLLTNHLKKFKNGFLKILLLSIFCKKKLEKEIEIELEAQINQLKSRNIKIDHIDGHRHVHFIPLVFNLVVRSAKKHEISVIRFINENIFSTFLIKHPKNFLWNGGLIKWFVLTILALFNKNKINQKEYFFSILYTGLISKALLEKIKIPKKFKQAEIMIHPGNPDIDKNLQNKLEEKYHLFSNNRIIEQL